MKQYLIKKIRKLVNQIYYYLICNAHVSSPYVARKINVGKKTIIPDYVYIADNVDIGAYTYFNSAGGNIFVESKVKIGNFCSIGPGVHIGLGNHPIHLVTTHPILYDIKWKKYLNIKNPRLYSSDKKINTTVIGNDVWIGKNALIMNGITVGDGAIIGAGSIVTKDVPEYAVVGGSPAKIIKYRFSQENIDAMSSRGIKWWSWDEEEIKENYDLLFDVQNYIES